VPQEGCAECGFVELDRSVPVADSQHGRNLSPIMHLKRRRF
jgi:hypothetical protein